MDLQPDRDVEPVRRDGAVDYDHYRKLAAALRMQARRRAMLWAGRWLAGKGRALGWALGRAPVTGWALLAGMVAALASRGGASAPPTMRMRAWPGGRLDRPLASRHDGRPD